MFNAAEQSPKTHLVISSGCTARRSCVCVCQPWLKKRRRHDPQATAGPGAGLQQPMTPADSRPQEENKFQFMVLLSTIWRHVEGEELQRPQLQSVVFIYNTHPSRDVGGDPRDWYQNNGTLNIYIELVSEM